MNMNRGFIALTSVLILSAIFLSITISVASRAISSSSVQIAFMERDAAKYQAQGCLEFALMELQRTLDYTGNEEIFVGNGTCDILSVAGESDAERTVQVESTAGDHTYRIEGQIEAVHLHVQLMVKGRLE